jgi:hypothetical protein
MTWCLVAVSPFLKANAGTVRSQTRFAVIPAIESRLERARTAQKSGMTHHLAVSSVNWQPVRTEPIPSGKCRSKGKIVSSNSKILTNSVTHNERRGTNSVAKTRELMFDNYPNCG